MNTIFMFLPIIILIIIFGLIFFITRLVAHKKNRYLSGNRIKWILLTYIAILIIAFAMNFLIPSDNNSSKNKEVKNIHFGFLQNQITNGNEAEMEQFLSEKWSFSYNGKSLSVTVPRNNLDGVPIVINRHQDQNESINVKFYRLPSYVKGLEITKRIPAPRTEFANGTLTLKNAPEQVLNVKTYEEIFTVNQFFGESLHGEVGNDMKSEIGNFSPSPFVLQGQLIYISIPTDMEVKETGIVNIEYMSK